MFFAVFERTCEEDHMMKGEAKNFVLISRKKTTEIIYTL